MAGRRDDVLATLRAARTPLSIVEIGEQLGIHPNTARFHLDALLRAGRVESVEPDRAKPGRPPLMFRATPGMDPEGPRDYQVLASIFADEFAARRGSSHRAVAAGHAWAEHSVESARTPTRTKAVNRLSGMLAELGFAPEKPSTKGDLSEIALRNCPFLELARLHRDVVCPVHLGLMQGALRKWDAPVTVSELIPFVEPDLCVVHLVADGQLS